jgi:hypothetical protein
MQGLHDIKDKALIQLKRLLLAYRCGKTGFYLPLERGLDKEKNDRFMRHEISRGANDLAYTATV